MSEFPITHRGTVYPWQCDHMDHMNVMWYVAKFDEASWQFLSRLAMTRTRIAQGGTGMAAVEQRIEYKREVRSGDAITIRTKLLEVKDKTIRVRHEMTNDETGDLAAAMEIVAVHIDMLARKARPLPFDVRERALRMIGGETGPNRAEPDAANRNAHSAAHNMFLSIQFLA